MDGILMLEDLGKNIVSEHESILAVLGNKKTITDIVDNEFKRATKITDSIEVYHYVVSLLKNKNPLNLDQKRNKLKKSYELDSVGYGINKLRVLKKAIRENSKYEIEKELLKIAMSYVLKKKSKKEGLFFASTIEDQGKHLVAVINNNYPRLGQLLDELKNQSGIILLSKDSIDYLTYAVFETMENERTTIPDLLKIAEKYKLITEDQKSLSEYLKKISKAMQYDSSYISKTSRELIKRMLLHCALKFNKPRQPNN